ncbi:hypothetical protein ACXVUM_12120 [Williamsia sp. SKLECPSW1]
MTDKRKFWIDMPGGEPVKLLKNQNRPGLIMRQATSVIFVDAEIVDQVIDAMCDLADQVETTGERR